MTLCITILNFLKKVDDCTYYKNYFTLYPTYISILIKFVSKSKTSRGYRYIHTTIYIIMHI